jgi:hypothetical protein
MSLYVLRPTAFWVPPTLATSRAVFATPLTLSVFPLVLHVKTPRLGYYYTNIFMHTEVGN